jgi:uncharacterized protein YecE (DUF72 family)
VGRVWVGCSGWQYKDWRGELYPPGCAQRDWLEVYARHFDTVEVNATFYRLPNRDAVARWVEQTPAGFVFTVKVSRYATHIKRLTTVADSWLKLRERIEPMIDAGRLGPLLWQLPANFKRDDERLAAALAELPREHRHAFEFRDASWFADDVYALLREHGVATVLADDARRPLPVPPVTGDFGFVRFHYGKRGRGGNYSDREIAEWAPRVPAMAPEVFVYYNNDWQAFAPRNAQALEARLQA